MLDEEALLGETADETGNCESLGVEKATTGAAEDEESEGEDVGNVATEEVQYGVMNREGVEAEDDKEVSRGGSGCETGIARTKGARVLWY